MPEQKPQLIILPGWGGNKQTWSKFVAIADQSFDVVCIELPCFGDEPCPTDVWGVEEYAYFVRDRLDQIPRQEGQMRILLGHSFGGHTACYLASTGDIDVDALILVAASAIRPKRVLKRTIMKLVSIPFYIPGIKTLLKPIRTKLYNAIGSPDYAKTSGIMREIFRKVIRQDLRLRLPYIKLPTLVVWGTKDNYTPLRHGKMIAKLIPNADISIVENGTHGLHLKTQEMLYNIVTDYVSRIR